MEQFLSSADRSELGQSVSSHPWVERLEQRKSRRGGEARLSTDCLGIADQRVAPASGFRHLREILARRINRGRV